MHYKWRVRVNKQQMMKMMTECRKVQRDEICCELVIQ